MANIVLITTGGTIASTVASGVGYTPKLDGASLIRGSGIKQDKSDSVETLEFSNVLSQDIDPNQMLNLAKTIDSQINRDDVDGVVVTHGTVVMEETAFLCDLVLSGKKPIVFTGAMIPSNISGSDVFSNIKDSFSVVRSSNTRSFGVVVCMNGTVHAARWVRKTHTDAVDAFQSPQGCVLGTIKNSKFIPSSCLQPILSYKATVPRLNHDVCFLSVVSGMEPSSWCTLGDLGSVCGLVVEGFPGTGAVTPALARVFTPLISRGVIIILASRSLFGSVRPSSGGLAGSFTLQSIGVMMGGSLSGPKLRLLLMIALSTEDPKHYIEEVIDKSRIP